ncbi:MAG: hypothetical protein ACJAVV_003947 [Alphaproteobacteria bacterium]|jgi:hypothetical protein
MTQNMRSLVYVASNHKGLESERYEVTRQLARMGMLCCGFPCRDDTSPYDWELARSQIEDADLFIMILGDEYGSMTPTGISYLHREWVYAQSLSKPLLSFVKNFIPTQKHTEEQRRLAGFHGVISKGTFRFWHLREELLSHVKTAVSQALTDKVGSWLKESAVKTLPATGEKTPTMSQVANKPLMLKTRQLLRIKFSAKVYERGNNTLEEISFALRWDTVFRAVSNVLKVPCSEGRLRGVFDKLVETEVKQRLLLLHPSAHAVDDIRINREQFNSLIRQWSEQGLIENNRRGARNAWLLTAEGELFTVAVNSAKPIA